ncbi:hypothetical protein HF679_08265 [Enterobacter sp. JUb54]|uniref:hypothetical protein n=1 Tax=Enterobacter sp. JUb54 TaxID=2724468 RepID=UPI00164DF8D4|nr:hypothetical protein [Enterobacter sp. JUb54]QNK09414.1 hypothetical protein HF679_08265 [Enterobacter sp. JUb54]
MRSNQIEKIGFIEAKQFGDDGGLSRASVRLWLFFEQANQFDKDNFNTYDLDKNYIYHDDKLRFAFLA